MKAIGQQEERALFWLLRAGLWGKASDDLSPFPLSAEQWTDIFQLARYQTVTGIICHGLSFLPENRLPAPSLLMRWAAEVDAIERKNRQMNAVLVELCRLFANHRLHPVLQKGQGVGLFYRQPQLRESGDIDFYFPDKAEQAAAVALIRAQGLPVQKRADGTWAYTWKGIEVEHHPYLFDLSNPFIQGYLKELEQEFGFCRTKLFPDQEAAVTIPSPLLNFLLLNTHIMKHAIGWGIGLRQFCDLARACACLHSQVEPDRMKEVCRKTGILKWTRLLHAFLVDNMGLSPDELPFPEADSDAKTLNGIVLKSGNFGLCIAGRNPAGQAVWKRKFYTFRSFVRNIRFSSTYVPGEAFWTFTNLLKGQF